MGGDREFLPWIEYISKSYQRQSGVDRNQEEQAESVANSCLKATLKYQNKTADSKKDIAESQQIEGYLSLMSTF